MDHHIWPSFIAIYSLAITQPVKYILMCRSWEMPNCTACWGCPHVVGSQWSWGERHYPPHCHSTQTSLASSNLKCRSAETCLPNSWHAMSPNLYFRKHFQSLQHPRPDNSHLIRCVSSSTAISLWNPIAFRSMVRPQQLPPSSKWENRLLQAKWLSAQRVARKEIMLIHLLLNSNIKFTENIQCYVLHRRFLLSHCWWGAHQHLQVHAMVKIWTEVKDLLDEGSLSHRKSQHKRIHSMVKSEAVIPT